MLSTSHESVGAEVINTGSGITHPGILSCLARAGHFSQIVIADGNFPASVHRGTHTEVFYLNWKKGEPKVTELLEAFTPLMRIQKITMMEPPEEALPSIVEQEVEHLIGRDLPIHHVNRWDFYTLAESESTAGIIVTGDDRRFANLILEIAPIL